MSAFISYLVTCSTEGSQLNELFDSLLTDLDGNEIVILQDQDKVGESPETEEVLNRFRDSKFKNINLYTHKLNNHYGEHKTYGKSKCSGKWIVQIDGDEVLSSFLLDNLKSILEVNDDIEMFWVPRINDFKGVTQEHANQWGWRLSDYEGRKIVNWPDYQSRIFQNKEHLRWERRLHEKIEHAKTFSKFPESYDFAIIHNKTIERQVATNLRYNKEFSQADNRGF